MDVRQSGQAQVRVKILSGVGCDGQYAAEQVGPLQGPHTFLMEGPQRGVIAGVERGGLFPQRVLACQPGRAVPDLDVGEARLAEAGGEVRPAQPGTEPLVGAVERLPAGQRHPAAAKCRFMISATAGIHPRDVLTVRCVFHVASTPR